MMTSSQPIHRGPLAVGGDWRRKFIGGLAFALALTAAGTLCLGGPDITHTEIQDTAHYGPVGTIHGYAWGSHTCNIGNGSLSWENGGSPALAMNAYRLHNGRLLQIGLGNSKHACCVANGGGCGMTCSSTGFGLRAGCKDIYSAGFNGGQGRLGPRSGINAYDSTFAAIPAGTGDAVWRRVQIQAANMSATTYPGALYFAEGNYVCLEEMPVDALNNATYRRATVANTGTAPTYLWTVAGATRATRPAIYAWADHGLGVDLPDSAVRISAVDVPNEGRYFVAGKVRALPNNQWLYDYAVFNLNSHRSGASFSIDLDSTASATGIGFNAPVYHSGEVYANTPWTSTRSAAGIEWKSPQTYSQNQNTNALRWGTMYNFWFTSSAAPSPIAGSARLGLFRPGTPTSIQLPDVPVPCLAPVINAQPQAQGSCPCQRMSLAIGASGGAAASYQWQRESGANTGVYVALSDGPSGNACAGEVSGTRTSDVTFYAAADSDAGNYRCIVSSPCGTVTSEAVALAVCVGDFNCDGATEGGDIEVFFEAFTQSLMAADTNEDGGITGQDVEVFFTRWADGC